MAKIHGFGQDETIAELITTFQNQVKDRRIFIFN